MRIAQAPWRQGVPLLPGSRVLSLAVSDEKMGTGSGHPAENLGIIETRPVPVPIFSGRLQPVRFGQLGRRRLST